MARARPSAHRSSSSLAAVFVDARNEVRDLLNELRTLSRLVLNDDAGASRGLRFCLPLGQDRDHG